MNFKAVDFRYRKYDEERMPTSWHAPLPPGEGRRDMYPEFLVGKGPYQDRGCSVITTCIGCPLPQCLLDQPPGYQRQARNEGIYLLFEEQVPLRQIEVEYNISSRTVQRIKEQWRKQND